MPGAQPYTDDIFIMSENHPLQIMVGLLLALLPFCLVQHRWLSISLDVYIFVDANRYSSCLLVWSSGWLQTPRPLEPPTGDSIAETEVENRSNSLLRELECLPAVFALPHWLRFGWCRKEDISVLVSTFRPGAISMIACNYCNLKEKDFRHRLKGHFDQNGISHGHSHDIPYSFQQFHSFGHIQWDGVWTSGTVHYRLGQGEPTVRLLWGLQIRQHSICSHYRCERGEHFVLEPGGLEGDQIVQTDQPISTRCKAEKGGTREQVYQMLCLRSGMECLQKFLFMGQASFMKKAAMFIVGSLHE